MQGHVQPPDVRADGVGRADQQCLVPADEPVPKRAVAGPLPDLRFVATGGIDATNAADFLAAGARVVGVGSALADPRQVDRLAELARG
ncbi:hypothetical protein AB0873_21470 [Micromonospora sp. NPDC047707]|uniref:hypothetical protein n=1 Tax=Micromonospora sp. NPDC047707 TaxID=3154498 RepID=UPI00345333D5